MKIISRQTYMSTHTYEKVKHISVFRKIITMSGDISILATKTMVLFSASPNAATILQAKRLIVIIIKGITLHDLGRKFIPVAWTIKGSCLSIIK
jgi:hypothetical protein